jgi:hypothetical protein
VPVDADLATREAIEAIIRDNPPAVLPHATERPAPWTPPTEGVNYGRYPSNYVALVKAWFNTNLKDPYSVHYTKISKPRKEHDLISEEHHEALYAWSVCATVNAKNSFGGYIGNRTTWFLIDKGEIVRFQSVEDNLEIYPGRAINCDDGK